MTFPSNGSIRFYLIFFGNLKKFNKIKTQQEKTQKKKKINAYDTASELYNELLGTCFEEYYNNLPVAGRKTRDQKYKPKKLILEVYNYKPWFENEESWVKEEPVDEKESVDSSNVQPLQGDEEEVKEGKGLKILTPKKLLTRFPILLEQAKAGSN